MVIKQNLHLKALFKILKKNQKMPSNIEKILLKNAKNEEYSINIEQIN